MSVTHLWLGGEVLEVTGDGYEPNGSIMNRGKPADLRDNQMLRRLLQVAVLCNNAMLYEEANETKKKKETTERSGVWAIKGDPTEGALTVLGAKAGLTKQSLDGLYRRTLELPFDSERKRMSVIVEHQGGRMACTKGAPDLLVQQCAYVLWDDKVIPFTSTLKQKVLAAAEGMAKNALRVLGLAYRDLKATERNLDESTVESQLVFIGLTGMIDPPRREVRDAIVKCRRAGIKTVMITGDHQTTAEAIAKQLGILQQDGLALNGQQLAAMSDDELDKRVNDVFVYARVSPEHKLRIVKSLQRQGHTVAMTGDGVNDAPAIKAAISALRWASAARTSPKKRRRSSCPTTTSRRSWRRLRKAGAFTRTSVNSSDTCWRRM